MITGAFYNGAIKISIRKIRRRKIAKDLFLYSNRKIFFQAIVKAIIAFCVCRRFSASSKIT